MWAKLIDLKNTFEGKFLAVMLSVLLATSMVNFAAFAGDEVDQTGQRDGAATTEQTEPASETPEANEPPASQPAPEPPALQQPAPESPTATPPAPEPSTGTVDEAVITLEMENAFIVVKGQQITGSTLNVPRQEELAFVATPDDGYEIDSVKAENAANADVPVATQDGTSKIAPEFVDSTLVITVKAKAVETDAKTPETPETTPLTNDMKIEGNGEVAEEESAADLETPSLFDRAAARVGGAEEAPRYTFNLVYNSNYPDDAKKFVYDNGQGTVKVEDAQQTNAVYPYEQDSSATIIGNMTLANYTFKGWSADPYATEPDSAYAPGTEVKMLSNLTLYAVWGDYHSVDTTETIKVRYKLGNDTKEKSVKAVVNGDSLTFVLSNNQDTFVSNNTSFRGWEHNGSHYDFNATLTTSNYTTEKTGPFWDRKTTKVVTVNAWLDSSATYAQFFVYKRSGGTFGVAGSYYSVGTGSINAEKFAQGAKNGIYPNGQQNKNNDVSSIVTQYPDAASIASILNISLSDTENIRWYVAKSQNDGYHVDGVIYDVAKYWNVYFHDGEKIIQHYVKQDSAPVSASEFPAASAASDPAAFEGWYNEAGQKITDIEMVGSDIHLYAKYKDRYNVTGRVAPDGGGTITNASQSIVAGGNSEAMEFTASDSYVIESVTINKDGQDTVLTDGVAGKTSYTYDAQTAVNSNISVLVKVAKADYPVDILYIAENGGTVSRDKDTVQAYAGGTIAGAKAVPNSAYEFDGWYVGDQRISTNPVLSKSVVDQYAKVDGVYQATTFTAQFAPGDDELKYDANGGAGTMEPYERQSRPRCNGCRPWLCA